MGIKMEKFCVISNSDKDTNYEIAEFIKTYLESIDKTCIIVKDVFGNNEADNKYIDVTKIIDDMECAIVLGGDGTMIQAANNLIHKEIPILGVNLGTLGFLTGVEKQDIIPALDQLVEGNYTIESRMMLKGNICCCGEKISSGLALNDFVIGKRGFGHVIHIKVYINDDLIDTHIGDGIIVSTSTGSTGYNLSAGGPILSPNIEAIIITPICSHSFNQKSIVVSPTDKIVLKVDKRKGTNSDKSIAIRDGKQVMEMEQGDVITIEKADKYTRIIKLKESSFFIRLNNKFGRACY
jgi:NAD+ kinase